MKKVIWQNGEYITENDCKCSGGSGTGGGSGENLNEIEISDKAPTDPNVEVWVDKSDNGGEIIPEAPKDGQAYVRKNGKWEKLTDSFIENNSYGVKWVAGQADPHLIRIGNLELHKTLPIQSKYRGCVAKGKNIQYYLNASNWKFKEDGSESILDGTDGDVRVHTPKFYFKSSLIENNCEVRISEIQFDDTWTEVPSLLISAYRVTVDSTNKARSVVNTTAEFRGGGNRADRDTLLSTDPFATDLGKPRTAMSRSTMRTYARNNNSEILCYEYYKYAIYWAFVIEYANFNSQETFNSELTSEGYHQGGLGSGLTTWDWTLWGKYNGNYPITPCGYANNLGNNTGTKELIIPLTGDVPTRTLLVSRYRGIENPFGDVWINLEGIVAKKRNIAKEASNIYTTTDPACFDDSRDNKRIAGVEIPQDGYISKFDLGSKGEIIPSAVGSSTTTGMCDYHYCNVDYTGDRTVLVGGCAYSGSDAGLGCFCSDDSVGNSTADVGFLTNIVLD